MGQRIRWHERPVAGPVLSAGSSMATSAVSFTGGYLLMNSVRWGLYSLSFMCFLLMLYIAACCRESRQEAGR